MLPNDLNRILKTAVRTTRIYEQRFNRRIGFHQLTRDLSKSNLDLRLNLSRTEISNIAIECLDIISTIKVLEKETSNSFTTLLKIGQAKTNFRDFIIKWAIITILRERKTMANAHLLSARRKIIKIA